MRTRAKPALAIGRAAGGPRPSSGHAGDPGPITFRLRAGTADTPDRDAEAIVALLREPAGRVGLEPTAYDTAWLGSIPSERDPRAARYPFALRWLAENQLADGSWGGRVRYEHDRVLSTLAAVGTLAAFGRRAEDRARVAAGTRYLWQHGHLLAKEPAELVGFELLLPALVERAQKAGVAVPPHLDVYEAERAEKLRLIPPAALYSPRVTVVHSLEFLGDAADLDGLRAARGANGGLGNSPAATAFYLARADDPEARAYLEGCLAQGGGLAVPVLHPCETFELLWAAYHLHLAGVPARHLLNARERTLLREELRSGGVSLSPTFPIADADDTAVALLLLHDLGETVDPTVLAAFELPGGHFASFPYERHASIGVNLHVLHTLLRVPGYPEREQVIDGLVEYIAAEQIEGLYWLDKWHISPYYATAHALRVLAELPAEWTARLAPVVERAREWLRQTQNEDGSWGFYGQPTAEETAYALLGLTAGALSAEDRRQCAAGRRYLKDVTRAQDPAAAGAFPPLWIDKCLYTPPLVVRAVLEAAERAHDAAAG